MPRALARAGALALSACALGGPSGCGHMAMWDDFSSVSIGTASDGRLRRAAHLPPKGVGYRVPAEWRTRDRSYGTEELLRAISRAAAQVSSGDRRVVLGVADISAKGGGSMSHHGSHESGRDVDLIFYSVDSRGKALAPPDKEMVSYDGKGSPFLPKARNGVPFDDAIWQQRRFDVKRNWMLVESLLSDPEIRVQWIFVSNPLREHLLSWAERKGRPRWAIEYARVVMRQPGGKSAPHDDHFHVRVYCSRSDRDFGCVDRGPIWHHEKKTWKFAGSEHYDGGMWTFVVAQPLFLSRG